MAAKNVVKGASKKTQKNASAVKNEKKHSPAKTAKTVAKKASSGEKVAASKAKASSGKAESSNGAEAPVQKRRVPIRNPGRRMPARERNPNRVAPHIARRPQVVKSAEVETVVPEISSGKAIDFARKIASRNMLNNKKQEELSSVELASVKLTRRPTTRKAGKETVKFPASDLKEFRRLLLEERKKAQKGVEDIKSTVFNEADDYEVDGGDGTNQTLRLQALGQMGNINRTIQQIDEALRRVDDGSYGVCTMCGQLIRKPRLLDNPYVLSCMECQNRVESREHRRVVSVRLDDIEPDM